MKANVRAVFGRRGEGEEEGPEELRRGKGKGGGRDMGVPPLSAAIGWGRVVMSYRAPSKWACEWLHWGSLGGVWEKGGDAIPRLRPLSWCRDSRAAETRANQKGGSRMAW